MLSGNSEWVFVSDEIVLSLNSDGVFIVGSVNCGHVNSSQIETAIQRFLSFLGGGGSGGQVFKVDINFFSFVSDERIVFGGLK